MQVSESIIKERARKATKASKELLLKVYEHPEWREKTYSLGILRTEQFWQTPTAARSNMESLVRGNLLLMKGNGRFGAVPDEVVREAVMEGVKAGKPQKTVGVPCMRCGGNGVDPLKKEGD